MTEKSLLVQDFMNRKVLTFDLRDDVADIAATLLEQNMLGAPVLDVSKKVVGFVSEQDCIKEMLNTAFHCEITATAADVMHADVLTVDPQMDIADLAQQMTANKPKMYPVVSPDGRLMGLITRADVLRALVQESANCHHPSRRSLAHA